MKKAEKAIDAGRKTVMDIAYEVRAIRDRDPAARSNAEVLLLYPGLHAVLAHRAAHYLHGKKHFFAARAISQVARGLTGIEIHPARKSAKACSLTTAAPSSSARLRRSAITAPSIRA